MVSRKSSSLSLTIGREQPEVEGMRIPTRREVTWHLASGDFSWFKFKITEIEYNQSGKGTVLS